MDLGLTGRVAVVTGASRGIGRQIAVDLASEGCHLVLNARDEAALAHTAAAVEGHGVRAVKVVADLFDPETAAHVARRAADEFGRLDILVNNAGGGVAGKLLEITPADWLEGFELNFFSSVRMATACVPLMLEAGWGRVVSLSSTYGVEPGPYFGPYSAAKAALMNYSKNLSRACSARGVLANCVIPGITITDTIRDTAEQAAQAGNTTPDAVMAKMMERDPVSMGRFGRPEEVSAAVVFLASEAASWITGAALAVDGGTLRSI